MEKLHPNLIFNFEDGEKLAKKMIVRGWIIIMKTLASFIGLVV